MANDNVQTVDVEASLKAAIEKLITTPVVSPYKISTVLSSVLGRKVQGPHIYSYRNKTNGFVSTKNEMDKWIVKREDAIEFSTKFALKNMTK